MNILLLLLAFSFVETFDEAWQSRWRPQVTGSVLSRRFEPQIKAACKEVWEVAQENVQPKPAGPLVAKNKAIVKKSSQPTFIFRRRGLFRRR